MKTILQNGTEAVVDRYSAEDIESEFGIKTTARNDRIRAALKIKAIEPVHYHGKKPYFDAKQMEELRFQNQHLESGGTLKSYQELRQKPCSTLATENGDKTAALDKYWGDRPPIPELDSLLRNAVDAVTMNPRLEAYAQFEVYIKFDQAISDTEVKELMGWKPPRTGFRESCYQFNFYGYSHKQGTNKRYLEDGSSYEVPCLVKQKLWKVEKVDLEKELAEKKEKKRQKKLDAQKMEEEKANQNYDAVKEILSANHEIS